MDADSLFTYLAHDRQGFMRLAAYNGEVTNHVGPVLAVLDAADEIVGHNLRGFDLQALARHQGAD